MRHLALVSTAVLGLAFAVPVPAQTAQAATRQDNVCVDGGGNRFQARVAWGERYTDSSGVKRVMIDFVGFTTADNVPVRASVSVSAGSQPQPGLRWRGRWDYRNGATFKQLTPPNPPAGESPATVEVSVGVLGDGQGNCTMSFTEPVATTADPQPAPSNPVSGATGSERPLGPAAAGPWSLAFSDEFEGSELNLSNWRPNWLAGSDTAVTKPVNSAELSCYDPANVKVAGGSLQLTAERRSCTADNGQTYDYASGLVQSSTDYRFAYGFAEARMFLPPDAKGSCGPNWAAFWLNGDTHPEDGEIDVMECLSGDNAAWHYHWGTDADHRQNGDTPEGWDATMPNSGDGWHTFGVDWAPGRLDFYYDGRLVGSQTQGVTGSEHFLILNLGVSGRTVSAPQTALVDYVRVWKR